MILRASSSLSGILDISGPEVLGNDCPFDDWLGNTAQFRRSMRANDIIEIPDEYLRFPNIRNAVDAGLLVIVSYDSRDESIVINAELSGFSGGGGGGVVDTKFVLFDIHGGSDTAQLREVDGTPCLTFKANKEDNTAWTATIPRDYVSGDVYVQVYWSPSNSSGGGVRWRLNYKSTASGASLAIPMTAVDFTQAAPASPDFLTTTGTSLAIPAAVIAQDRLLTVEIRRLGNHADDTHTGDAQVSIVRLRYTGVRATT